MIVPVLSSKVMEPAGRYEGGIRLVMVKSGVVLGMVSVLKLALEIRTRRPQPAKVTFEAKLITITGFRPPASHTRSRANDTEFWRLPRIRSWIAWAEVSPFTPPITCSICMKWKVVSAE